jgi:D-amino peptidase
MNDKKFYFSLFSMILIAAFFACESQQAVEVPFERELLEPAQDADGEIKILLYYDMEGVSGQNLIRSLDFGNDEYFEAREWLTDDVNAVIDGLFSGGADAVDVVDAHGSGNPEPDILLDKMDPRARMIYKDNPFRPYVDLVEPEIYDAVVVVCMHSKTGGGGFAAHTYTLGMDWIMNDMSINESEIIAYSWGRANVPLIFASGDDKLEEQLSWMSWLEYVQVKKAKGAGDAELRPFEEVHTEMRQSAKRSVEKIPQCKAVKLREPIKAQLRAVHPANLGRMEGIPGIDYENQTVTFDAQNFQEAYDGIVALVRLATTGYSQIIQRVVLNQEKGPEIFKEIEEQLFSEWIDVESGHWKQPAPQEKGPSSKKYFGAR